MSYSWRWLYLVFQLLSVWDGINTLALRYRGAGAEDRPKVASLQKKTEKQCNTNRTIISKWTKSENKIKSRIAHNNAN